MRIDRFITLRLAPLLQNISATEHAPRLPILMYHSISEDPETGVRPYYRVATEPKRFSEHLQWLAEAGYRGVSARQGLAAFGNSRNDVKQAVITFDDGFRDFYDFAFPILRKHGFSATVYLPTAFIGENHRVFKSRQCMTWTNVRELCSAGIDFGSHTVNHPKLVDLTWPEIIRELSVSKDEIEQQTGCPVESFAYPYAFPQTNREFTIEFCKTLSHVGYANCMTTAIGRPARGADPFQLPRLPANSSDDQPLFLAKMLGYYDWMNIPQGAYKSAKTRLNCLLHAAAKSSRSTPLDPGSQA